MKWWKRGPSIATHNAEDCTICLSKEETEAAEAAEPVVDVAAARATLARLNSERVAGSIDRLESMPVLVATERAKMARLSLRLPPRDDSYSARLMSETYPTYDMTALRQLLVQLVCPPPCDGTARSDWHKACEKRADAAIDALFP